MNRKNLFLACWYGLTPGRGWGIPVLWEGPPGGSKTSQLEGWAQELGTPFIHASPSMLGEGWFGVVPVPQMPDGSSDMVTTFPPNEDVWRINNIGRGLILFDELRAVQNKSVQAAMLGTFQERRFANLQLAVGVRVMAASNSTADSVGGRKLDLPTVNRMLVIPFDDPTPEELRAYGTRGALKDPFALRAKPSLDFHEQERIEREVLKLRPAKAAEAVSQVVTYCEKVGVLRKQPKATDPASDQPWCSPRSWVGLAAEVLTSYRTLTELKVIAPPESSMASGAYKEGDNLELLTLLRGAVGPEGAQFVKWIEEQDLPDYGAWLDGSLAVSFAPRGVRDDRLYTILRGAEAHILALPHGKTKERRGKRLFEVLHECARSHGLEVTVATAHALNNMTYEEGNKATFRTTREGVQYNSVQSAKMQAAMAAMKGTP